MMRLRLAAAIALAAIALWSAGCSAPAAQRPAAQRPAAQTPTVSSSVAARWARGTFPSVEESMAYHLAKHGRGRTAEQYTRDALDFFARNRSQAQWGTWNPNWEPSYRLKVGSQGGYYDADGRVLTYWD